MKRHLVAKFSDGTVMTRSTTIATLAFGWRVVELDKSGKIVSTIVTGFSSRGGETPDAKRALKWESRGAGHSRRFDCVAVTVETPAKKAAAVTGEKVRIKRTFKRGSQVGKFLKDGRSHRWWKNRADAEAYIKRQVAQWGDDLAVYEIV